MPLPDRLGRRGGLQAVRGHVTPTPEVVTYLTAAFVVAAVGYACKRILSVADRLDILVIQVAQHELKLEQVKDSLARGRVKFDELDRHFESTDGNVSRHQAAIEVLKARGA